MKIVRRSFMIVVAMSCLMATVKADHCASLAIVGRANATATPLFFQPLVATPLSVHSQALVIRRGAVKSLSLGRRESRVRVIVPRRRSVIGNRRRIIFR